MTNETGPELIQTPRARRAPPAMVKIKRGGTGKVSNSGNAAGRFRSPNRRAEPTRSMNVYWDPDHNNPKEIV